MRHVAKSSLVVVLLVATAGLLPAADKATIKRVYKETNGLWELVSRVEDGQQVPAEELKGIRMELKNGTWTAHKGKELINIGSYKLLSVKNGVRMVAAKVLKGKYAGNANRHISKSEGDKAIVCYQRNSKVPPKEFASKKGSGYILDVWKRVKK